MPRVRQQPSFEGLIAGLMTEAGINNTQMADRVGVSRMTWTKWKKNPATMPMAAFRRMCDVLRVPGEEVDGLMRSQWKR